MIWTFVNKRIKRKLKVKSEEMMENLEVIY